MLISASLSAQDGQALREDIDELYIGILGRAAHKDGQDYWYNQISRGALTLEHTRASFVQQVEYREIYENLTISELIRAIYQNFLEREPAAAGLSYWREELYSGRVNTDQFVNAVINAVRNAAPDDPQAQADLNVLKNKLEVAEFFTDETASTAVDSSFILAARDVLSDVTDVRTSVDRALELAEIYAAQTGSSTANMVGAWGFSYPRESCDETYYFSEDGTLEINSNEEIALGRYVVSGAGLRRQLNLLITSDNLGMDCEFSTRNDAGSELSIYAEFESNTRISLYSSATGGEQLVTLQAVLWKPNGEHLWLTVPNDVEGYERGVATIAATSSRTDIRDITWSQVAGPSVDILNPAALETGLQLPEVSEDSAVTLQVEIEFEDDERRSALVELAVRAYANVEDVEVEDVALDQCIEQESASNDFTDIGQVTSLECSGVGNLSGLEMFLALASLSLPDNTVSALDSLFSLTNLETLNITGNSGLSCSEIESLESQLNLGETFYRDDYCVTSRSIELGAIGFDTAIDETREQIYISIPSRNEIVVVSTSKLRVVDRISLPGSPYGIDLSIDESRLFVALRGSTSIASLDLEQREITLIPLADKTGHPDTYDVVEGAENRLFVSASPGSGGLARVAQIRLDEFNLATSVANNQYIRSRPTFARSPDHQFVYVGSGFSPNSLYKLSLVDPDAGIALEDDHGSVSGTHNLTVNPEGTRIALGSGQVLRTGSFIEEGRVNSGISVSSKTTNTLFVNASGGGILVYDFDSLEMQRSIDTGCSSGASKRINVFNQDTNFALLQSDVLCIYGSVSVSESNDAFAELRFDDLGLERCVIDAAQERGYTSPDQFEALDCSGSETNILNLNAIQKMQNLKHLDLSGHGVLSLEPLASAESIESLSLRNTNVSDVEYLFGLTSLTALDVRENDNITCDKLDILAQGGTGVSAEKCTSHARIELGAVGADMAFNRAEERLLVSIPSMQQIAEVDLNEVSIANRYAMPGTPQGIDLSADGETLYAALFGDGDIGYLDLTTGETDVVDLSTQLDDDRTWDVAEVEHNRIVVSSNPGSNGFAYIVEVRRDEDNAATRVAGGTIIRARPIFAADPANQTVYIGSGFSPNSLYKLDASDASLPIVLEDDHGQVSGTDNLTLSADGSLIYLSSGQVLATSQFNQVAKFPSGKSWLSNDGTNLYIAEGELNAVGVYDVNTTAKVGRQEWGCNLEDVKSIVEAPGGGVIAMGDDLVCFVRIVPYE